MKYHSSCQRLGSHGTTGTLQAFPFETAPDGASACGFVSVRACACVIAGPYSSRNQEQSQEQRCQSSVFCLFFFRSCSYAVCCYCCVPVSQRKLLTSWQPRFNSSSRTSRSSLCEGYEQCFCVCVCAYYVFKSTTSRRGTL